MFDHAMNVKRLSVEFCYCSVFDECWSVKGQVRAEVKASPGSASRIRTEAAGADSLGEGRAMARI